MINQKQLEYLCKKYKIKYQFFENTDIAIIDTGLDIWQIKHVGNRDRPYCLLHKNKIKQTKKYHVQRWVKNFLFAIDTIVEHKKVLVNLYGSPRIHRQQNKNIKRKGAKANYK